VRAAAARQTRRYTQHSTVHTRIAANTARLLLLFRPRPHTSREYSTSYRTRQAAVASPALPCPAEYIASYSTPDRPTTSLPLIHTRVLSIRDLFLRLSDHCNAHCLSAIGAHDILELSKLCSWIALLQLQPALDTEHPIPHRACTALRRKLELGHLNQRASIRTQIIGCKSTDYHTQNTPSGTCLRRPQLLTGRPHIIGYYQPDWRPTTAAAPNAG
jgi:hypothetical protein